MAAITMAPGAPCYEGGLIVEKLMNHCLSLTRAWQDAFKLPDRRPIHEWAAENLKLPAALTRRRFDPESSRHFIPVLEAMADDAVSEVVVRKPVRAGGTLLSDVFLAWARVNDPGNMLLVMQSDELSKDHFINRLRPMMLSCP